MAGLDGRRLYLCTPDRPDLERFLAACIRGGVDVVQLRDKELAPRHLLERARLALRVCRGLGVPFVLNDRPDLALEVGADGVHVGQDDAPPALARRILGPDAIVGHSTRGGDQLAAATGEPVDYVSVGPVLPTATHPTREAIGFDVLRAAAAAATVPFFVTGNVRPDTIAPMIDAGARQFVVVRYLTESSDPEAAARTLRTAIDDQLAATPSA
jgi:thiamine-phosphate pyrophosphorylase